MPATADATPKFADNIVNQRFREVFEALQSRHQIRGKSDLAQEIGTYNHVVNNVLKSKRNITIDQLTKLFEKYGINANYMFGLSDDMFLVQEDVPTYGRRDMHIVGRNNIVLVNERARAGYATEHQDTRYLESLQRFSVPGMEGQLVAFEISGDSMTPTITNGDLVICEPIERGTPLYDNQVYVVVTDVVVAKRVRQQREGQSLVGLELISDNRLMYQPYEVDLTEVRQLLKVKCRLTDYAIA